MTREEAIKMLKSKMDGHTDTSYEWAETVRIAIEALEQKPSEDCVSRQAAIDAFEKFIHELGIEDEPYNYGEMALSIKNVPSVTPQQKIGRWIKSTGYDNRDHFYTCSECGRNINLICGAKLADYPYCHCGAKMEVENNG